MYGNPSLISSIHPGILFRRKCPCLGICRECNLLFRERYVMGFRPANGTVQAFAHKKGPYLNKSASSTLSPYLRAGLMIHTAQLPAVKSALIFHPSPRQQRSTFSSILQPMTARGHKSILMKVLMPSCISECIHLRTTKKHSQVGPYCSRSKLQCKLLMTSPPALIQITATH